MPLQPIDPIDQMSSYKKRVENVSWETLQALDAEPSDDHRTERNLIGDLQAEFLLSLLTPSQQEVSKLLATGLAPIEVSRIRGVSRLQICRMRKRIKARLAPYYQPRTKKL